MRSRTASMAANAASACAKTSARSAAVGDSLATVASPVAVAGPGVLDITAWRQKESLTVHLVNLTNPMMMKGPVREAIPIGPLTLRVRVPSGLTARKVHLLTAGTTLQPQQAAGAMTLTVPTVDVHEVVAIDLEPARR